MAEISAPHLLARLREVVGLLAAPAAQQERWLAEQRYPVDELALQLDDAAPGWFTRLFRAGLLTEDARQALQELNDALGSFSGPANAVLWTEEAQYSDDHWEHARNLARRALMELGNRST